MERTTLSLMKNLSRNQSRHLPDTRAQERELSVLSAVKLLRWKKNVVGPRVLGFKVDHICLFLKKYFSSGVQA